MSYSSKKDSEGRTIETWNHWRVTELVKLLRVSGAVEAPLFNDDPALPKVVLKATPTSGAAQDMLVSIYLGEFFVGNLEMRGDYLWEPIRTYTNG